LALYMDNTFFGGAVPAFSPLRIQRNSFTVLGNVGFGNDQNGLFPLKGSPALNGTALAENAFGGLLLPGPNQPRSVDLWPIFHTGVPNMRPYQLATGKPAGNPLAAGKPFINNFLPNGGDMLRLNMAVPVTPRNSADFSSLGLVQAAVLGLTDSRFNSSAALQFIPNMDGFPNGRRLEDDVTRIELQAVSGVALAAIGLWYDDYQGSGSPVTQKLLNVLTYSTGINQNDAAFQSAFPYEQMPWSGTGTCSGETVNAARPQSVTRIMPGIDQLNMAAPDLFIKAAPSVFTTRSTINYHLETSSKIQLILYDALGKQSEVLLNEEQRAGTYTIELNGTDYPKGNYFISAFRNGELKQTIALIKQ
jgi:hypothetical protein